MNYRIPLADLDYGEEEETAVLKVLRSRWLTMGETTQAFEQQFAQHHHIAHAFAVANATVALHMACVALNIGPGDEVIVPSLTFVATANAVLYTGATVRFADINGLDDLTIAPEAIAAQINEKTKAIIVVHYAGYPCQMSAIMDLAQEHQLAVIEDAAHAPGASLDNRFVGGWGDVGCFSFFSNKNLATGEGGMVVTNRADLADRLRYVRSHGMTSLTWDRHKGHAYSYDVVELGYNYRIDEIHSALGLVQLQKLTGNNHRRATLTALYREMLAGTEVGVPFLDNKGDGAYHIFPILLPHSCNRLRLVEYMRSEGIQTSIHYPPIHQFHFYQRLYGELYLPQTEEAAARELTLPLFPTMGPEAAEIVVTTLLDGLRKVG